VKEFFYSKKTKFARSKEARGHPGKTDTLDRVAGKAIWLITLKGTAEKDLATE